MIGIATLPSAGRAQAADDLAAMVRNTPAGGVLRLAPGQVYRLDAPLTLTRPISIEGHGATVAARDGARIAGALIRSDGVSDIRISGVTVDANVDRDGADYGVWIIGGTGHRIVRTTVQDTSQACILLQDASGSVEANTLRRCGRALTIAKGGAANDHGIMIAALTRAVRQVNVRDNIVDGAWRKGITSYARAPGTLADVTIADNIVSDCGLGGIYVANAPGAAPQRRVTLSGNVVRRSNIGLQIDDVVGLTMASNRALATRDRSGGPGAQGVVLDHVDGATIVGLHVENSGATGLEVRNSTRVVVRAPVVVDPNGAGAPFGPGIHFSNTRDSSAEDVSITDDRRQPKATHGVVENDGSRANRVTIRRAAGVPLRLLVIPPPSAR